MSQESEKRTLANRLIDEKMKLGFETWLESNRRIDENTMSGEVTIEAIRQNLELKLERHFRETEDQTWCKCDTCTLIRLKAEDKDFVGSLALVGLEYLLGQNFNGAAALTYYSFVKETENES